MFDVVVRGQKPLTVSYDQPVRNSAGSKPVKWPRWPARKKMRAPRRG
jgi:hypothetical protein